MSRKLAKQLLVFELLKYSSSGSTSASATSSRSVSAQPVDRKFVSRMVNNMNSKKQNKVTEKTKLDAVTSLLPRLGEVMNRNAAYQDAVRQENGVAPLVKLVDNGTDIQKEKAAWVLASLVDGNVENKEAIRVAGGVTPLVTLVHAGNEGQKVGGRDSTGVPGGGRQHGEQACDPGSGRGGAAGGARA